MTRLAVTKTSFTSGEIDPVLYGRIDLRAYEEGAARLRNVIVERTGGVRRRFGTKAIASVPNAVRIIPMETSETNALLVLEPFSLTIVVDDLVSQSGIATPWDLDQLREITWVRIDDALMICHGDIEPRLIRRDVSNSWVVQSWSFETADDGTSFPVTFQPFVRYADRDTSLNVSLPGGGGPATLSAGSVAAISTSAPVFSVDHIGTIIRQKGIELEITNVASSTSALAIVRQDIPNNLTTRDWDELAFSQARGWPICATRHQARLVLGGSPQMPDMIWLSKTGRSFNYDLGTGLDDEAISFRLTAEQPHRIRHLFAGRRLQVFTNAGEWIVSGEPLTPSSIQLDLQTRVGSPQDRQVMPIDVDGATLFIGKNLQELREFLFADTEQAYQSYDIALLSRHLMSSPIDMTFHQAGRLVLIVMEDGGMVAVTIDRNQNVTALTRLETQGRYLAVASLARKKYMLVERGGQILIELEDENHHLDNAKNMSNATPIRVWNGFEPYIGQSVSVIADGNDLGSIEVTSGSFDIGVEASELSVGFPFNHEIEALPIVTGGGRGISHDIAYRPVRISWRLSNCGALAVDTGNGAREVDLQTGGGETFSGDISLRAYGWRRGTGQAPWRIDQSNPAPFALLSVTTDIKVND